MGAWPGPPCCGPAGERGHPGTARPPCLRQLGPPRSGTDAPLLGHSHAFSLSFRIFHTLYCLSV